MSTAVETALGWAVHAGWQAGLLALTVLLGTWAGRGRLEPRWCFALWLVVLARLALPVTPPAPWSLARIAPAPVAAPASPADADGPSVEPIPPDLPGPELPGPDVQSRPSPAAPPLDVEARAPAAAEQSADPTLGSAWRWLAVGWLAGVGVLLARQVRLHVRLARQRREWHAVTDPVVLAVFGRCREEMGVRRPVRLLAAPGDVGPATDGVLCPRVVVPEGLLRQLTPGELRAVLLHELAHVRRWDVLIDRVAAVVVAVHWFNPVAWLALAGLRRERELACDAAVLRRLGGGEAGPYGHALVGVAERLSAPRAVPGAVAALGRERTLDRRIYMIAHFRTPTAARMALGGMLVALVAAVGLTDAASGPPAGPAPKPPAAPAKDEVAKPTSITGVCQDRAGQPVPGVRVVLYRGDVPGGSPEKAAEVMTGDDGRFAFPDAVGPDGEAKGLALTVTKAGYGSCAHPLFGDSLKQPLRYTLRPAATLQGRVTDEAGKPVAGARVWSHHLASGPLDGVTCARTDSDGRYAIPDMTAWDEDATKPKPMGEGRMSVLAGCYFDVRHPDYGHERPMYRQMPATVDVVLRPGGAIAGTVVDRVAGKPAAGVVVSLQGTKGGNGFHQVRTGPDGKYRLPSLTAGMYNLWADAPDRACAAIDSIAVEAGKTVAARDLELTEGGWLEGQIVDAATGAPIGSAPGRPVRVAFYGPARPKTGACCQTAQTDEQGRFRHRVPPGKQFVYIFDGDYWGRTQRREYFDAGIEVKADEIVRVVLRVLPAKPLPDPDPAPVRLRIPVPAERAAAARVRERGGWYQVDGDGHVVELNMVYHETPNKQRFDNDRADTDEGLRAAAAFPKLKRLLLTKGQASDDGLRAVAGLADLEAVLLWDADRVTDAGIAHLAGLGKLTDIHVSNSKLGDGALAVFGRLTGLRTLSLQQNAFTDDGLKHLAGLKELRSLALGMNRNPLTDAGVVHLAGLTRLQSLDLQHSRLSDAGVAALKDLTDLRYLYLRGGPEPITDAGVDPLLGLTKLQRLWVQGSRLTEAGIERLLGLPELTELSVSTSAIPEERREDVQKRHPRLRLYVEARPPK